MTRIAGDGAVSGQSQDVLAWRFNNALLFAQTTDRSPARTAGSPQPNANAREDRVPANWAAGPGVALTQANGPVSAPQEPPPLPEGAPPPNMSDRHDLSNANFYKGVKPGPGAGNSYLTEPMSDAKLNELYREAYAAGPNSGEVTLKNGQTWYINKTTGKFFPVKGPGVISLTQQEVAFLRGLQDKIKKGVPPQQALEEVGRAMGGQKYVISENMSVALSKLGPKFGYTAEQLGKALAPYLPESANVKAPPEAEAAAAEKAGGKAFRFVKWGGRTLLVVGLAVDAYEVYNAENKPKTITKKVGAWGGGAALGGAAAEAASPLLAGGPWGWAGYGVIVAGAGAAGYFAGGEITETIYEWTFE